MFPDEYLDLTVQLFYDVRNQRWCLHVNWYHGPDNVGSFTASRLLPRPLLDVLESAWVEASIAFYGPRIPYETDGDGWLQPPLPFDMD